MGVPVKHYTKGESWRGPYDLSYAGKEEADDKAKKLRSAWRRKGGAKFSVVQRNGSIWIVRTDGKYGKGSF